MGYLLVVASTCVQADSRKACQADFVRVCPDWPGALYAFCRVERSDQFSEACQSGNAKSPEEAAWWRSKDNRDSHSDLLIVPTGAKNPIFMSNGLSDHAAFQYRVPYPGQDLADRILKQWQKRGYLPIPESDMSWNLAISKDGRTVARVRRVPTVNSKGQMADLRMAYMKKFDWSVGETQASTLDLGDELRVLEVVAPVRRYWDGKLPVFSGREVPVD